MNKAAISMKNGMFTLSMVYKKRCKKETSPFLSNFCWCHCSIYDVIASLLLNKASKIRLVVSYKAFLINHTERTALYYKPAAAAQLQSQLVIKLHAVWFIRNAFIRND